MDVRSTNPFSPSLIIPPAPVARREDHPAVDETNERFDSRSTSSSRIRVEPQSIIPLQNSTPTPKKERALNETIDLYKLIDINLMAAEAFCLLPFVNIASNSDMAFAGLFDNGLAKSQSGQEAKWQFTEHKISVQFNGSQFATDATHEVSIGAQKFILTAQQGATSNEQLFSLEGWEGAKCVFAKNQWHLTDAMGNTWIFGGTGAFAEELFWPDWKGIGSDMAAQKPVATSWYLSQIRRSDGLVTDFSYESALEKNRFGINFIKSVVLKEIRDNNQNQVALVYKSPGVLLSLKISTADYIQSLDLSVDNLGRISSVMQKGLFAELPIISFTYNHAGKMEKIELGPLQSVFQVEYAEQSLPLKPYTSAPFNARKVQTAAVGNYVIRSFINLNNRLEVAVLERNSLALIRSSGQGSQDLPFFGENAVASYTLFGEMDHATLWLKLENGSTEVWTIALGDEELSLPVMRLPLTNPIMGFGPDYIIALGGPQTQWWLWSSDQKRFVLQKGSLPVLGNAFHSDTVIACQPNRFFVYDDFNLWMGYKNSATGAWQTKKIAEAHGYLTSLNNLLEKFATSLPQEGVLLSTIVEEISFDLEFANEDIYFVSFLQQIIRTSITISEGKKDKFEKFYTALNKKTEKLELKNQNELQRVLADFLAIWVDFTYFPQSQSSKVRDFIKGYVKNSKYLDWVEKIIQKFCEEAVVQKTQNKELLKRTLLQTSTNLLGLNCFTATPGSVQNKFYRVLFSENGQPVVQTVERDVETLEEVAARYFAKREESNNNQTWRSSLILSESGGYKVLEKNITLSTTPYQQIDFKRGVVYQYEQSWSPNESEIEFTNLQDKYKFQKVFEEGYKVTITNLTLKEDLYEGRLIYKVKNNRGQWQECKPILKEKRILVKVGDYWQNQPLKDDIVDSYSKWFTQSETLPSSIFKGLFEVELPALFFLNNEKYQAAAGNNTILSAGFEERFDGQKWIVKKLSNDELTFEAGDQKFGQDYVISKAGKTKPYQLYKQNAEGAKTGEMLFEFPVAQPGALLALYPFGFAYEKQGYVMLFNLQQKEEKTVALGSLVIEGCNYVSLCIKNEAGEARLHALWPFFSPKSGQIVKSIKQVSPSFTSSANYHFDAETAIYAGSSLYGRVDLSRTGSTEVESYFLDTGLSRSQMPLEKNGKKGSSLTGKVVYDAKKQEVQRNYFSTRRDEMQIGKPGLQVDGDTLFSYPAKDLVANFEAASMSDQEADYIGFESYEPALAQPSRPCRWQFDRNFCLLNQWSFTGQKMLRLDKTLNPSGINAVFKPKNQNQVYIASGWFRAPGIVGKGKEWPYFQATIQDAQGQILVTISAKILHQWDDWFYAEVRVPLPEIKGISSSDPVGIKISVVPGSFPIDIDHIRFSPDSSFYAQAYVTGGIKDTFGSYGFWERMLVDSQFRPVTTISTDGKMRALRSTSNVHNGLVSELEINPERGEWEPFSPFAFAHRWRVESKTNWRIAPGRLYHSSSTEDSLQYRATLQAKTVGLRFTLLEVQDGAEVKWTLNEKIIKIGSSGNRLTLEVGSTSLVIPPSAEIICLAHPSRLLVFVNGSLSAEETSEASNSNLMMTFKGQIGMDSFCLFQNPTLQVAYKDGQERTLQERLLDDDGRVVVTHYLYDEAGHLAIQTIPCRLKGSLSFDSQFITNGGPGGSLWKVGAKLEGTAAKESGEYGYYRSVFGSSVSEEPTQQYLPGPLYANGPHSEKITDPTWGIGDSVKRYAAAGFSKEGLIDLNGRKLLKVFDSQNRLVGFYASTAEQTYDYLLTINTYDERGNLIKQLPPNHFAFGWENNSDVVKQELLARSMSYDNDKRLVKLIEPDSGIQYRVYHDLVGDCTFAVQLNRMGQFEGILAFQYSDIGQLTESVLITEIIVDELTIRRGSNLTNDQISKMMSYLQDLANQRKSLEGKILQQGLYGCDGKEPKAAGRDVIYQTNNGSENASIKIEERYFYLKPGQIGRKWTQIENIGSTEEVLYHHNSRDQMVGITYPVDVHGNRLKLSFVLDTLGRISQILREGVAEPLAVFHYTADGKIVQELQAKSHLDRKFSYNEVGFLTEIQDGYMHESLSYTEGGYNNTAYYDGTVARSLLRHLWTRPIKDDLFVNEAPKISLEDSKKWIHFLRLGGYIDANGFPNRVIPPTCLDLPAAFGGVETIIRNKFNALFPLQQSHQYQYGPHMQLTHAKYSLGDQSGSCSAFGPDSFRDVVGDRCQSLWKDLKPNGVLFIWGSSADGIFGSMDASLQKYQGHLKHIQLLMLSLYTQNSSLNLNTFSEYFLKWRNLIRGSGSESTLQANLEVAKEIWEQLKALNYLDESNRIVIKKWLNPKLQEVLDSYPAQAPQILAIIYRELFIQGIGLSPFDLQALDIDPNGNHKKFYAAHTRMELIYQPGTNQPVKVNDFAIGHDTYGNINRAQHKKIAQILYNPLLKRATHITMEDGTTLTFAYDHRGERVLKQVFNADRQCLKTIQYIRDELGRVLLEKETDKQGKQTSKAFIYGPRGLLGFVQGDNYYTVLTDHLGSVRAIISQGEVVAAYDYLPYGQIIRSQSQSFDINYLFSGQEFDVETGLYNFHARLYDPELGRFYQIDPQRQFSSPYVYVGNSPISAVDPNGEIAILLPLLIAGLGLFGAYLGGAAANNSWDPSHWNWKSGSTYLGMGMGGLTGALLPVGFGASVGVVSAATGSLGASYAIVGGTGLGVGFLGMAAANHGWNPAKWEWRSPQTWNGLFQGFTVGSSVFSGASLLKGLSNIAKGGTVVTTTAGGYLAGASSNGDFNPLNWNWEDPSTYYNLGTGALGGMLAGAGLAKSIGALQNIAKSSLKLAGGAALGGGAFIASASYLIPAATSDKWNPADWEWRRPEVYNALFGGLTSGFEGFAIRVAAGRYLRNYGHPFNGSFVDLVRTANEKGFITDDVGLARNKLAEALRNDQVNLAKYLAEGLIDDYDNLAQYFQEKVKEKIREMIAASMDVGAKKEYMYEYLMRKSKYMDFYIEKMTAGNLVGYFEIEKLSKMYDIQFIVSSTSDTKWVTIGDNIGSVIKLKLLGSKYAPLSIMLYKESGYRATPKLFIPLQPILNSSVS